MAKIHDLIDRRDQRGNYRPSTRGHIPVARDVVETAWVEYQKTQRRRVPNWTLDFAFRSLSLDPPPPSPAVADCLTIIAIDLGCDVSNIGSATLDESARVEEVSSLITQKVKTMAEAEDHRSLKSKHIAITALLPYAVWQERDGQSEMFDTILHAARASRMLPYMVWYCVDQFFSTLFSEASPRAIVLASPHIHWGLLTDRGDLVQWWAATASIVPYTDEVAQSVVNTLLHIASEHRLIQHIPADVWSWLTKWPSLPPICLGRRLGTQARVVKVVRGLRDIEVLKSYLLLVWSEWDIPIGSEEICTSIREDFGGIGMGHHRADLIQRLNHVLGQLNRGLGYLKRHNPWLDEDDLQERKDNYRKLRETLLGTDTKVVDRSRTTFICALPLMCP